MPDLEIDFPRGGTNQNSSSNDGKSGKEALKNRKRRRVDGSKPRSEFDTKDAKRSEYEGVWRNRMDSSQLTEGVLGLGAVREIHDDRIEVESSDGILFTLPATNISDQLTNTFKSSALFTLNDIFVVGQMIAFKVVKIVSTDSSDSKFTKKRENRRGQYVVSCNPRVVNAHLVPSTLYNGLVLNGAIESVEDKGVILNLGLRSTELRAFLPSTSLPQYLNLETVFTGQILLVRIEKLSSGGQIGRVINVSGIPEMEDLEERATSKLRLNMLMPGTILSAEPLKSIEGGVYVALGNDVKGFIRKLHLPPRLRADTSKLVRTVRVVVMFCQQNTQLLALSAHPDITALSKPSKRSDFEGISIGDTIMCESARTDDRGNVHFNLVNDATQKASLVSAFAAKVNLQSPDEDGMYKRGTIHKARVLSYKMIERQLVVSTKSEIFNQKMVSLADAVPGEKVRAKIESVQPNGLFVRVYNQISGFIPLTLVSDKQFTRIEKHYSKDQLLDCRIVEADPMRNRFILTSKPSLINTKNVIIKEYDASDVDKITVGFVRSKHSSGGLIIGLFGGVRAFMLQKEASRLGDIKLGCSVQLKIKNVDAARARMLVSVADPSLTSEDVIIRSDAFARGVGTAVSYPATVTGTLNAVSDQKQLQRLELDVHLGKKLDGTVHTSMAIPLLSDSLNPLIDTLKDCFKIGAKIMQVTVLGENAKILKVTSKRFVIDWLERHSPIKSFDDLSKGLLVCGTVSQHHHEMGYFVELAGGSALTAPARFLTDDTHTNDPSQELQIGQTVIAYVSSVDVQRKRFSLLLNPSLCYEATEEDSYCWMGMRLLEYTIADLQWCTSNLESKQNIPSLGSEISVTIIQPLNDVLIIEYGEQKLKGCARKGNFPTRTYKKGERVKALLIDIALPSCELDVFIIDESNGQTHKHLRQGKKNANRRGQLEMNAEIEASVAAVKRDYIATVTTQKDIPKSVIYIPSRFHPNVSTPEPPNGRFEHGMTLKVRAQQNCGNTLIGLAEGDLLYAKELLTAKLKRKQDKVNEEAGKKKVKPFMIYPAKVIGLWNRGAKSSCAIELELPGGNLGRLHVSELNEALLEKEKFPLAAFLRAKLGKTLNVKVIAIGKITESTSKKPDLSKPTKLKPIDEEKNITSCVRVAECTLRNWKMAEGRKKQSLLGYQQDYIQGEWLTVFVKKPIVGGTLQVEVSPVCSGIVEKQNLGEDNLLINPTNKESALVDTVFEPGQALKARVIGISDNRKRSRRNAAKSKTLELSLVDNKEVKGDERVIGRVILQSTSPASVTFALSNGQRAIITPTAVNSCYTKALNGIRSYQFNEVYFIYLIRFDDEAGRWIAVSESRYDECSAPSGTKKVTVRNPLLKSVDDIEENSSLEGFVSSTSNDHTYVEIAPGISGRLEQRKCPTNLQPDQLITVRVLRILPDGGLRLKFVGTVAVEPSDEKGSSLKSEETTFRKRTVSAASSGSDGGGTISARKKSKMAGFSGVKSKASTAVDAKPVHVHVADPGLDWSLSGFTPADLMKVAKIGESENGKLIGTIESENDTAVKKGGESDGENAEIRKKPLTKKEREIAKEKELSEREKRLIEKSVQPESQADFDRLLTGSPNSSELWIRYISFFVSQKDIEKARAIAERALSVINYREEEEIFNVWTAYLNLELSFGNADSLKSIFDRAITNSDALKMYKQMVRIYQNVHKDEEVDNLLEEMLKKFRHDDLDVWFVYGQHLMQTKRFDKARDLLKRATKSLPQKHHVNVINRFAQMEYKYGDSEQGKTLFESILSAYPRKVDVWSVYLDMLIKNDKISEARQVFDRVTSLKLGTHKMRVFFKKWIDMEQKFGSEEQQKLVRERAVHFIEDITEKMDL